MTWPFLLLTLALWDDLPPLPRLSPEDLEVVRELELLRDLELAHELEMFVPPAGEDEAVGPPAPPTDAPATPNEKDAP